MNIWRIELPSRFFVTRNDEPEHNIQQKLHKSPASVQVSWERRSLAEVLVASIHVIDLRRSVQGFYFEGHILCVAKEFIIVSCHFAESRHQESVNQAVRNTDSDANDAMREKSKVATLMLPCTSAQVTCCPEWKRGKCGSVQRCPQNFQ